MSDAGPFRLVVTPLPEGMLWEIRDSERRIGHGSCATEAEIRGVEIRSGVAAVEVCGRYVSESLKTAALLYGWRLIP